MTINKYLLNTTTSEVCDVIKSYLNKSHRSINLAMTIHLRFLN